MNNLYSFFSFHFKSFSRPRFSEGAGLLFFNTPQSLLTIRITDKTELVSFVIRMRCNMRYCLRVFTSAMTHIAEVIVSNSLYN